MVKINRRVIAVFSFILLLLFISNICFAAISRYISVQAKVTEKSGLVLNGSYSVTFRIYSASSGGTSLWSEAQTISISSGILDAILGQTTAFPSTLTFNTDYWLSIEIGSDGEMSPRIRLTGAPYSLNADKIDAIDSSQLVRNDSDNTISGYLSVNGNLTAGDASSDSFTINAATISLANASTLDLANSSTTSLNIESGLLNFDTSNSRIGIGTTAPEAKLQVSGGDMYVGTGTFDNTSSNPDAYIQGNLEVDGTIYATVSGSSSSSGTSATTFTVDNDNTSGTEPADGAGYVIEGGSGDANLLWDATNDELDINKKTHFSDDITVSGGEIYIDNTDTLNISDGTNNLLTLADAGSTGNLTLTGNIALSSAATLDLANSSAISLNVESGLLDLDTQNSRVGIGTTAPEATLQILGGDMYVGTGTFNNASANPDEYVQGNLEVDGIIYGNGAGITGVGTMSSFTAAGDSGTSQTISDGNTLTLAGGTNGIDTAASDTDTVTFNFDPTEVGTNTWGSGSAVTWTFDAGAVDPIVAFGSNSITIQNITDVSLYADLANKRLGIGTIVLNNTLDVEGAAVIGATYSGTNTAPTNGLLVEGNVGIGSTAASAALDVGGGTSNLADGAGDVLISADLEVDDQVEIDGVNAQNNGANILTLTGLLGKFNGSDTFRGIFIDYTNPNHAGASNFFYGIDIDSITGSAAATENAINIGTGWDAGLVANSPVALGTASTTTGSLVLYHASSALATTIQPGNATSAVTYTLPTAAPTVSGQVLASTTGGALSWAGAGVGGADTALSNLASVAINTALLPQADGSIDLGSVGVTDYRFRHLYLSGNLSDETNSLTVANVKTAYDHSQSSSQAHSDYLINNGDDTTSGALTIQGGSTLGSGAAANISLTFDSSAATDMVFKWDNTNTRADVNKALSIGGTGASTFQESVVINEGGNDQDTRIEGDTDANLIYIDASADKVGIGGSAPISKLDVLGTSYLRGDTGNNGLYVEAAGNVGIGTTDPGSALEVAGNIAVGGSNNELRFYEGTNYVGFEAPALSADKIWVLPTADGSSGQALITNGTGTLSWSSAGTMSSFTAAGDSGSSQTISDGNTLTLAGGTNGIDTAASATDTVTLNFDPTEVGTNTWGSGSAITWTFDAGASDPTIAFGSGNVNFGVSLQIPTATNPTVDTEGEVGYDSDDENIRVYDGSANRAINSVYTVTKAIFDPDAIQPTEDDVPILAVEDEWAPFGITLLNVGIKTNSSSTYSVDFQEWTDPIPTSSSSIETVATSAGYEAQDDGTLTDSSIAAGSIIYVDLPTTDIDMLTVWLTYYINTGD